MMIPVDTAQDVIAEGDEGFEAILSNPTNGLELGSQDRAGVTIRDDDGMGCTLSMTVITFSFACLQFYLSTLILLCII